MNTSAIGAAHEMIVCADLILKGYDVFRAVSGGCSVDLVVVRDRKLCKVEVTTACLINGKFYQPKKHKIGTGIFDLLATVHPDRSIAYLPTLEDFFERGVVLEPVVVTPKVGECPECGNAFTMTTGQVMKYCSARCRTLFWNKKKRIT